MNRRESIGRIHDLPVSAGHLVDQGKERVAEQAQARHQTNMLEIEKAIPLGVVRYTYDDGADQARNHRRIHLTITVDFDNNVRAISQCRAISGDHCAADTLVFRMTQNAHPRVRALPVREVEHGGVHTLVVRYEQFASTAGVDVLFARDTLRVLPAA